MTGIPRGPAHHPSASREGAFPSQQVQSFLVLLINFLRHFALVPGLPADGPRQGSKGGGWGEPRRAEKGFHRDGVQTGVQSRGDAWG